MRDKSDLLRFSAGYFSNISSASFFKPWRCISAVDMISHNLPVSSPDTFARWSQIRNRSREVWLRFIKTASVVNDVWRFWTFGDSTVIEINSFMTSLSSDKTCPEPVSTERTSKRTTWKRFLFGRILVTHSRVKTLKQSLYYFASNWMVFNAFLSLFGYSATLKMICCLNLFK